MASNQNAATVYLGRTAAEIRAEQDAARAKDARRRAAAAAGRDRRAIGVTR